MDFARKQLLKYGWEEGKGLGKNENGIAKPVKATLKFDTAGFGCSRSEQFTNQWWDNVYNNASKNLKVKNKNGKVKVKLSSGKSVEISTKKMAKKVEGSKYGLFLKTSELTEKGIVELPKDTTMESDNSESDEKDTKKVNSGINSLTDEEIYKACGGRTAHKGARHGLKLSGKLARLEEQEMLLSGVKNIQISRSDKNDVLYVNYKQLTQLKRKDDKHRKPKSNTSLKKAFKKITAPNENQSEALHLSESSKKKQKGNGKIFDGLELTLELDETENNRSAESKFKLLSLSESHKIVQNSNEQELANEIDLSKNSFKNIREKTKSSKRSKSKHNVQANSVAANAKKNKNEWMQNEESILVYRNKRKREEDDEDYAFKDRIKRQYWSVFDVDMYKVQKNLLKEKIMNLRNKKEELFRKVDKYDTLWNTKREDGSVLRKIERRQKKYKTKYEEVCQELGTCKNELKITRRGLKVTKTRLYDESKLEDVLETISNISVTDDSNQG